MERDGLSRAADALARRRLPRREFLLHCTALAGITGVLAACSSAPAAPSAPAAAPTLPAAARKVDTIATAPPATAAAQAAPTAAPAAKAAAPAAKAAAPAGKLIYAWHTTISPAWLDPQENPPQVTPYNFAYCLHDALVKHLPGKTFSPSLAESYEIAPDFKSATFKLRAGIKFHDGTPVTPDDVKFTYEQYRGANASILKQKLDRIEGPDDRTVKFYFKEPFLDFLMLYGSPASGAGWVVPKAYYEKVGKDGFKKSPIGAGPFKFVKQAAGTEIEFEANEAYWRKVPRVKTIIMRGIPEAATRLALLQTGEIDVMNQVPGDLLAAVQANPNLRLTPLRAGNVWLELTSLDSPDSPLKDVKVRQAVSLALDRKAFNDAEMGGMGALEGNWIPSDWPGALERPVPPFDQAKAKQLLAEAGVPDGFEVSALTPLPPYNSYAERVVGQLRGVGIKTKVNSMERAAFYEKLAPGDNRQKGFIMPISGAPGDAMARIRENASCKGAFSGVCNPEIEDRLKKYDSSTDPKERDKLSNEMQTYLLDQYILVPVVRQAFTNALGPRIANKAEDVEGSIPQYVYLGPYEDLELKA